MLTVSHHSCGQLVLDNMGYLITIASKHRPPNLSQREALSAVAYGFLRVAKYYNPAKGKLSSYTIKAMLSALHADSTAVLKSKTARITTKCIIHDSDDTEISFPNAAYIDLVPDTLNIDSLIEDRADYNRIFNTLSSYLKSKRNKGIRMLCHFYGVCGFKLMGYREIARTYSTSEACVRMAVSNQKRKLYKDKNLFQVFKERFDARS